MPYLPIIAHFRKSIPDIRKSPIEEDVKPTAEQLAQATNSKKAHNWVLPLPKRPTAAANDMGASKKPVDPAIPQNQLDPKEFQEDLKFYTPRARKAREDDDSRK